MMPCDHKFVDSNHCLKCGWVPLPTIPPLRSPTAQEPKGQRLAAMELERAKERALELAEFRSREPGRGENE